MIQSEKFSGRFIDISVPLRDDLPIWPGSTGIRVSRTLQLERGDIANVSRLDCDVHVGTHIDAPLHFIPNGASVESIPLDLLIGPAEVVHFPDSAYISVAELRKLKLPAGTQRLLFHTRNSKFWRELRRDFRKDYVALTADDAQWLVNHGIRVVGIDYLSIQRFEDSPETHRILLASNVAIIEGLNLADVPPGPYELICMPLRLVGAEGAPARVALRPL